MNDGVNKIVNDIASEDESNLDWQRILDSRVTLNADIKIYLRHYRKQPWYLLVNTLTQQQVLVDETAHLFLNLLQKQTTVGDALTALANQNQELEQQDVVFLFSQLVNMNMLAGDMTKSAEEKAREFEITEQAQRLRKFLTPFSVKIPLLDPNNLLAWLALPGRVIFSRFGGGLFLLLLLWAVIVFSNNTVAIEIHWSARFFDPENLLWSLLLYPFIKTFHELGHGMAARRWGAEIHEMGIMLLIFIPVPYVNATPTAMFHSSKQRMVVAAAGILVELALAAVAIILWSTLDQGFVKDMCFNIAVIGGVSTLLFNGNPLLRFDGYYVLSDLLEIPNLGSRATAFLGYVYQTYLLGLDTHRPSTGPGETILLITYGVASGLYRLVLSLTIALYVAGKFFFVGVLLACWFLLFSVIWPKLIAVWHTFRIAVEQRRVIRFAVVFSTLLMLIPGLLFTVPVPYSTVAYGMVIPPERSIVRAQSTGFVSKTHISDGDKASPGKLLFELQNFEFIQEERGLAAKLEELEAEFRAALNVNPTESRRLSEVIEVSAKKQKDLLNDIQNLMIVSTSDGVFSLAGSRAIPGGYIRKGDVVGFVTNPGERVIRVMVSQNSIDAVRRQTLEMKAMSYSDTGKKLEIKTSKERPMATAYLPGASLGSLRGGPISVDARDPGGLRLMNSMYQIDMVLPDSVHYIGETFIVKFFHYNEPIGIRFYQAARRRLSYELSL